MACWEDRVLVDKKIVQLSKVANNGIILISCISVNHQLPESYNGLGYLNLISIIMEVEIYLEDFLKKSNETEKPADINLLFIEEPEAHTHPQLQYVFIKNIKSLLIDGISDEQGNRLINLQTIITSHSSHIVSECDFDDIKYFKRSSNTEVVSQNLKELETRYKAEKDPERNHFKFLKQYLTLNYSEIFFADKAILFEGETEGILLPAMLKKVDEEHPSENDLPLLSQNISLIASGAYSQIFDEFLSFIGIKTLIITDIDSGKESISKDKNGRDTKKIVACSIEEATHTTNGALLHYFETPLSKSGAKKPIEHLKAQNGASIATVISYAHKEGLCIIDDKLQEFIDNNEYLYWRVSDIAFVEVQNLYKYIEGHMPFSTQHKIKGLEFKNVLIVLHNGGWNNYNFEYLFNRNVDAMLTPAQKRSYPNILRRTQKLFYVCCTRAKDNLVVYYPSPSDEVLEGAVSLFGRDNCIDLDAE